MSLQNDASSHYKYGSINATTREPANGVPSVTHHGSAGERDRRQIGVVSAVFIIFNRMIGAGIFATPSTILLHSGSVGLSLILWVVGGTIAYAGMQVYIAFGTALPRNGGEKNYLEYIFRKPKYLISSVYAANGVLLTWAAGNSLVCGEYFLRATNQDLTGPRVRLAGFGCITFAFIIHGTTLRWGLRLQNLLGVFKILVLFIVVGTGCLALSGYTKNEKPHNFENIFEGTTRSPSAFCLALYNVLWSFSGFNNVNYALSEVRNPSRTLPIAGTLAVLLVAGFYMFVNLAYFAGATKAEITNSGRLVAALLFRNVYGPKAERVLSGFIALSTLGNVLSQLFSQGRVNQELGKDGILPFSGFWASNRPFNTPFAGLGLHWTVCVSVMLTVPFGDTYNFVLNVLSYPVSVVNALISFGLLYLCIYRPYSDWPPVTRSARTATLFFGLANVFLFTVPLIRPPSGSEPYVSLPYWTHVVGGWLILGVGFIYWLVWARILPWVGGYKLSRVEEEGKDGLRRYRFRRRLKL